MRRLHRLFLLLALTSAQAAQADETLRIPRAAHAPRIEDYVGGAPTDAGVEVNTFRQKTPGDGDPASVETHAYLSYDDRHLYVVFVCKDDPKQIRARIARRDSLFGDDAVQLFLDTFHDRQRAFVFSVNPYGAQMDSRLTEGLGYDFNFDTQWSSDGRITADGYVVTMAIPFKSLRFEKGAAQNWGIAINRIVPRTNEFVYWPFITQRKEAFVPQFATATIDDSISPGRNIQIIPHISLRDARTLDGSHPGGARMSHTREVDAGVDAKIVFQDALALDLTVNPDYSEVESDEPQVIVNQRYEVKFPEKRPFFLENSSFFGTPVNLFFSRRIVDPNYGARLTGRVGRWAVGGLAIDDQQPGDVVPATDRNAGRDTRIGVARLQRDFGEQSNVGVLATQRNFGTHRNTVGGVDSRYKLNDNWALTGQIVQSRTQDVGLHEASGHLLFAQATRGGRNFTYDGQYIDISDTFSTDLGFVPRTGIKQLYQSAAYLRQFPDAKWLVDAGPSITLYRTWDQRNVLQDWSVDTAFSLSGLRQTTFNAHWIESFERFGGIDFRKRGFSANVRTEWWKWLTIEANASMGGAINYLPANGLAPFLGDARQLRLLFTVSPIAQLRIDQNFIWDELRTRGGVAARPEGSNVFRSVQSRTKVKYQFSRFLAAHVIFDYAGLQPDARLIGLGRTKRLTSDVLVSYALSPGTAFYVGYTDQQENLHLLGDPRFVERTRGLDLHTGRQFFFKFSYLFSY